MNYSIHIKYLTKLCTKLGRSTFRFVHNGMIKLKNKILSYRKDVKYKVLKTLYDFLN